MPRALITNASGQFIRPSCQLAHRLKFLPLPLSRSLSLSFTILSRVNAFFDARAVAAAAAAAVAAPRGHGTRAYADSGANSIRFVPQSRL